MTLDVVYEDNHLLAVNKPAGLLAQGDETGDETLLDLARDYRKQKESKPGNVFVGLVHRLDRPVSGLILLAKTSKGAARLSEQFRLRQIRKLYLAVCEVRQSRGIVAGKIQQWEDRLARPGTREEPKVGKVQLARTRCQVRAVQNGLALVSLEPETGRKHQLRAQASMRGLPIVGDKRYGSSKPFGDGLALHALALAFRHPTRQEPMLLVAPPPIRWKVFGYAPDLLVPGEDFSVRPPTPPAES